jgi:hypothetical protein
LRLRSQTKFACAAPWDARRPRFLFRPCQHQWSNDGLFVKIETFGKINDNYLSEQSHRKFIKHQKQLTSYLLTFCIITNWLHTLLRSLICEITSIDATILLVIEWSTLYKDIDFWRGARLQMKALSRSRLRRNYSLMQETHTQEICGSDIPTDHNLTGGFLLAPGIFSQVPFF